MRKLLLALALTLGVSPVVAQNYQATQGAGTTFGSKLVTSVNYPQIVFCDPATPANCVAVNASGQITVIPGNTANTTPWLMSVTAGGNTATVKAASTAAAAADPSLVSNESPNSQLSVAVGTTGDAANAATVVGQLKQIQSNTSGATPAGSNVIGFTSNDPCTSGTKINFAIASATGTTQLVAPSGSTQVYVCSFSLVAAAAAVVNLVGGTGATCTTGTPVAALGSTTAANGMSFAANNGLTFGNGGATVVRTTTAGHGLCLIQSGTTALAGNITYIQQ
jgi:hypothetical protein